MKTRVLKCPRRYVINHTCQARSPRSRELSLSAVACFSVFTSFLEFFWSSVCVCVSFCLFSQAATSLSPTIPHVSADKRWGIIKHVGHILAEITHTGPSPPPSLIFHREEERDAYIILTEPEWRETSLCYLHSHMHCQRFMVQDFNGALTHLSPSVYLSPRPQGHANTHPSIIQLPLPVFLLFSVFPLSALHLVPSFTSHFPLALSIFFLKNNTKDVKVWFGSEGDDVM